VFEERSGSSLDLMKREALATEGKMHQFCDKISYLMDGISADSPNGVDPSFNVSTTT
jgi:hypothetical protein